MADNVAITAGTGTTIAADDIAGVLHQRVKISQGADGSATDVSSAAPLQVTLANTGANTNKLLVTPDTHAVTQSGTWTVQPGNTANTTAWKVDASSVAVPITDNSGSLTVDYATTGSGTATGALRVELPTNGTGVVGLNAGTNAIGKLAANSGVDIGDVDVTSVPTDPFGANADAASATGSISAKLKGIATALGVTALDLGAGTGGSRTLRVVVDSSQTEGSSYETVAASQTAQVIGATGATGDYLSHVVVSPATAGCGVVTILDNATTIVAFPGGGTTALSNLIPFVIPVGMTSVSGAWKITTGANVSCTAVGRFT